MAANVMCTVICPHCDTAIDAVFVTNTICCPNCGGKVSKPQLPVIDNAVNWIRGLRVVPISEYMQLPQEERRSVFSVPEIEHVETLEKIKDIVADSIDRGLAFQSFQKELCRVFGPKLTITAISIEKAFRGNIAKAMIAGLLRTIDAPLVGSYFPYLKFIAVGDDRSPATHIALEQYGLNGTSVYRRDDPFWRKFMPPLTDLCRCSVNPLSIDMAADEGVKEAKDWLRTGQPPLRPEWVATPCFDPRQELEDEFPEDYMCAQDLLEALIALRDSFGKGVEGIRSRFVLRTPESVEEGLALLQGRANPVFRLPPLDDFIFELDRFGIDIDPRWEESSDDLPKYLATIESMIACCAQTIGKRLANKTPSLF